MSGIPKGKAEVQQQPCVGEFPHNFSHLSLIYALTSVAQNKFICMQGLLHQERLDFVKKLTVKYMAAP